MSNVRTDEALAAGFARATLPAAEFGHREHVRVAWFYLIREPLVHALPRFARDLRRFAEANGAAGVYHETITWAFVVLIHERLEETGRDKSFDDFARANGDLFERSCLLRYYDAETLASPVAKRIFVLPPRPTPPPAPPRG